ncbi:MAG: heme exporter protein CcmB [Bacteroidota bacterium]
MSDRPKQSGLSAWVSGTWAVFEKDLRLELRSRYALNTLLLFVASSLLLVRVGLGMDVLEPAAEAIVLWLLILFAAATGLSRAFVAEEERGTRLLLQLHARPSCVYAGKLLFNVALTLVLNLAATLAFSVVVDVSVASWGLLMLVVVLGALGLAGATTLLSALIARSSNGGALFAVLAFPVLVPLLVSAVNATLESFGSGNPTAVEAELRTLFAYAGTVITASTLLFDYVWND